MLPYHKIARIFARVLKRLYLFLFAAVLLTGCTAGGPGPAHEARPLPRVYDLRVEPADGQLTLTWRVDRLDNHVFSGYNIYIQERPVIGTESEAALLERAEPFNRLPFPGDTDADITRETYTAEDLRDGVRYYCFVRAIGVDRQLGAPSNEVMAICRPGGRLELQPIFSGAKDGIDFSAGRYVNSDAIDCDLAFYHKDGTDHLIAPKRIDPLLNDTQFWDLGAASDFDSVVHPDPPGDGTDRIDAQAGHLYVYRTADGHFGKFRIESIRGTGDERTIVFQYMYQTVPELLFLK